MGSNIYGDLLTHVPSNSHYGPGAGVSVNGPILNQEPGLERLSHTQRWDPVRLFPWGCMVPSQGRKERPTPGTLIWLWWAQKLAHCSLGWAQSSTLQKAIPQGATEEAPETHPNLELTVVVWTEIRDFRTWQQAGGAVPGLGQRVAGKTI